MQVCQKHCMATCQHYQLSEEKSTYLSSMSQAGIRVMAVQRVSSSAHGLDWCHLILSDGAPM